MLLNYLTGDGQPDAQTIINLITAVFEMEETVKDSRTDLWIDTDAIIHHAHTDMISEVRKADVYCAVGMAELYGIIDQSRNCAFQGRFITLDRSDIGIAPQFDVDASRFSFSLVFCNDAFNNLI